MVTHTLMSEKSLTNREDIHVERISTEKAKDLIIKNHYTHKWSSSIVSLGVFKTGDDSPVGVVVYGNPVGRDVIRGMSPLLKNGDVLELKRLWIEDGHGKNIESCSMSRSFDWLKKNLPKVKTLISYADPAAGHVGGIYQATNWGYQRVMENRETGSFSISLVKDPRPEDWIHSRTAGRQFGCRNIEMLKRKIGQTFWIKPDSVKYRYVRFLCNRVDRKKIEASLKHPYVPYEKEPDYDGRIQEVTVRRSDFYK
jgi:hypothetical protein